MASRSLLSPSRLLLALAGALALAAVSIAVAGAAAPGEENGARLDATIRYLQETQNSDGGFSFVEDGDSAQISSAWTALALAAAGINPRCQRKPGQDDAYDFLEAHFDPEGLGEEIGGYPPAPTTAFDRELMVVDAAGGDPHDFDGFDLVEQILSRARSDGSFNRRPKSAEGGVNETIFAMLGLIPVGEPAADRAVAAAADWLESVQRADGSWASTSAGGPANVDMTGAAIQALNAAGRHDTEAERDALEFLRGMQRVDGGFPQQIGQASNSDSTAWVVQGLWSAGENPEDWLVEGSEPLSYLASLQKPDGSIEYKAGEDSNNTWNTAYTAPAFAGQAWPIPEAPMPEGGCPDPEPPDPEDDDEGGGGFEPDGGEEGVIAGGGSEGAPLFSRPKPGSRGRTPGGVRQIRRPARPPRNHAETRRGENVEQAAGKVSGEASGEDGSPLGEAPLGEAVPGDAPEPESGSGSSGEGAGAGSAEAGSGAAGARLGRGPESRDAGSEVEGALVSSGGAKPFGAPGLHGAAADADDAPLAAAGIGALALLFAVGGTVLEARRGRPL